MTTPVRRPVSTPASRFPLLLLATILAAACSRAVNVGTLPTPVFGILITNSTNVELIVSYDDGTGPKALGAVAHGATERFVIASPANTLVEVAGRTRDGSSRIGPIQVRLVAASNTSVELR
jgi:hypothetical protein